VATPVVENRLDRLVRIHEKPLSSIKLRPFRFFLVTMTGFGRRLPVIRTSTSLDPSSPQGLRMPQSPVLHSVLERMVGGGSTTFRLSCR
jgi:hypothetical protein